MRAYKEKATFFNRQAAQTQEKKKWQMSKDIIFFAYLHHTMKSMRMEDVITYLLIVFGYFGIMREWTISLADGADWLAAILLVLMTVRIVRTMRKAKRG